MGTIVVLSIFGLAFIVLAVVAFSNRNKVTDNSSEFFDRGVSKAKIWSVVAAVPLVVFILIFLFSSMNYTTARTVGIVTEFGKATGTIQPGLNWTAPWADVTEFPTSNQVLDLDATNDGPNVTVKFKGANGGGGSGFVNVNITWQVKNDNEAVKLWQNWKEFEAVKDNVVNPRGQAAVVEVFGRYTPEEAIDGNKLQQFNDEVKQSLSTALDSSGISVENVAIKRVDLSPEIQDRINKQVQAQADVQKAQIEQQRAQIDNQTNQLRQQSLTPEALIRTCMDVTNAWNVAQNGPLPASWNCFSGTTLPLSKAVG